MISQIENGATRPSVSTLYAISTALDISTDSLISGAPNDRRPEADPESGKAARSRRRRSSSIVLHPADRPAINLERGVRWERLTPLAESHGEFKEVYYAPGGGSTATDHAIRHNGREYCVILEGALSAQIGFEEYVLEPGDSMAFDCTVPHRFWNAGDVPLRAVWFVLDTWKASEDG